MSFTCQIRPGNKIARLEHLNIEHSLYKRVETTKDCLRALYMNKLENICKHF